jgi:3-oxoacid CoA-transferase subunit A
MMANGRNKITVAEVEELFAGALDPNQIHTPGIFVQRIFQARPTSIEQRTVSIKKIEN